MNIMNTTDRKREPTIILEGAVRERAEMAIGTALETAVGMVVGGMTGIVIGTIGVGVGIAAVALTAPVSVPTMAAVGVARAVGVAAATSAEYSGLLLGSCSAGGNHSHIDSQCVVY